MHSADRIRNTATVGLLAMILLGACSSGPPLADGTGVQAPTADPEVSAHSAETSAADGYLGFGQTLTPFDVEEPAISGIDADLLAAVQAAARAAGEDGVEIRISSGWRSTRLQGELLRDAVDTYGSEAEARRWVSTPEDSHHVTGKAVDVAFTDAMSWPCRLTYANEAWHYELSVEPGEVCPSPRDSAVSE